MFRKASTRITTASLIAVLAAIAAQAADLPSFHRVSKSIAVGGPPTDEGITMLYNDHFSHVIDLRERSDRTAQEGARVERMGGQTVSYPFHYVNIPVGNNLPSSGDLSKYLATVDVTPEQKSDWVPTFYIHGSKDVSLSAAMVAIWRIYHDDWDFDKAYAEMLNDGFNLKSPRAGDLTDFVKKYAESRK
jgi:hypothetical protein